MKKTFWMIGALVASVGLLPVSHAQETAGALPGTSPAVATGAVHVAKAPKSGAGSFLGMPGGVSSTNGGMVITSERMELDYKETNAMVVAFDENVHVTDPRFNMTCDRMVVWPGSNQIRRIIAIGKVDFTRPPDQHATCDKMVYEQVTGEIVFTGNPVMTRGADLLVGSKITIYQNDSRVGVDRGRLNLSPETMKNREIKP